MQKHPELVDFCFSGSQALGIVADSRYLTKLEKQQAGIRWKP